MDYQTIVDQRFKEYRVENKTRVDHLSKIKNDFGDAVFKFTVDKFKIKLPVSKDVDSSHNTTIKLCEIIDKMGHYKYDTEDITRVRLPYPSKNRVICSIRFNVSLFTSIVVTAYECNLFHIYIFSNRES